MKAKRYLELLSDSVKHNAAATVVCRRLINAVNESASLDQGHQDTVKSAFQEIYTSSEEYRTMGVLMLASYINTCNSIFA